MAEEGVTPNEEVDEEEEEEEQSSDDRQTLDDLTVLTDTTSPLDDGEEQDAGDDTLEWEEPAASQSLSTIHTGSRPTDAELMANLVPEGDTIIDEGEIVPPEEVVGAELPEVDAELPETEPDPEPAPEAAADAPPPPPPPPAPEEPVAEEEPEEEPVPEPDAAPAEPVQFAEAPAAAPPPPPPPEEDDEEEDPEPDPEPETEDVEVEDAVGDEDTAIALAIDAGDAAEVSIEGVPDLATLSAGTKNPDGSWTVEAAALGSDTDGSESLSVTLEITDSEFPAGTVISVGIDDGTGTITHTTVEPDPETGAWSIAPEDVPNLYITPPDDFFGDIPLTLTSTTTEADGGDTATETAPFTVTVDNTIDGEDAVGVEDMPIALDIDAAGASEIVISDLPDGAVLSAGTDNGDGTWTVQAADVGSLAVTPPPDSDIDFDLTISADGVSDTMTVVVKPDADMPEFDQFTLIDDPDGEPGDKVHAAGGQGADIPLDLGASLTDTDGSETLSFSISLPEGAEGTQFSAGSYNEAEDKWEFSPDDLVGLTVTPPEGFTGLLNLNLAATATEQDAEGSLPDGVEETATTQTTVVVRVTEEGTFQTTDAVGDEDNAIPLTIDPGTATEVTISDIPANAELWSGGTQTTVTDGSAIVTEAQLADLTITPPPESDVDFTLSIAVEGKPPQDLDVTVNAVADDPTALAQDVSGDEDTAIKLDLSALESVDTDGSETLSVTLGITDSEIPAGTVISVGTDNGDGTITYTAIEPDAETGAWTIDPADLANLYVTPPSNWDGEIPFDMTATSTEADGGDTASSTVLFTVTVSSTADFEFEHAEGLEDTAIALTINPDTIDGDTVSLSDIPADTQLQYVDGTGATVDIEVVDGAVELTLDQLNGLTITPPTNSDEDFILTVTAAGEAEKMHVVVKADADAPTATAQNVTDGLEDNPIDLTLDSQLTDTDGSETLSVTLSIQPAVDADGNPIADFDETKASFTAGTNNGDGTWTFTAGELTDLQLIPPVNFEGDIPITMAATSTETDGGDNETTVTDFTVTVKPDDSKPDFEVTAAEGYEDNAIALDIDPGTADSVDISNVPEGATLSAGTDNGNGTWTVQAEDLSGLTITPPEHSDDEFTLSVAAEDIDGNLQSLDIPVTVHAVADAPDLDVDSTIGDEDTRIPLEISSSLVDADGSETLSMTIEIVGVPAGSELTYEVPAFDDNGDPVMVQDVDENGQPAVDGNGDPIMVQGTEPEVIPPQADGTYLLEQLETSNQLDGLKIKPPQDYFGDITLQVTSRATEEAEDASPSEAETMATFGVTVRPVADNPEITVTSLDENGDPITDDDGNPMFLGTEDETLSLDISAAMGDTTTVELSQILLGGIEPGSTLTYVDEQGAQQTIEFSGSVAQLSEGQLNQLSITPPPDFNGEMDLTATAFSEDGGVVVTPFTLDIAAIADLDIDTTTSTDVEGGETTATVSGVEDTAIDLNISAAADEAITISGVPEGAELSAGTDNGNGTWSLTAADLEGLTITPPADSDADFPITVSAESPDGETLTGTINVSVAADADAPSLDLNPDTPDSDLTGSVTGAEDGAIPLSITTGLTDSDGPESLSITISGVPDGASLSAGTVVATDPETGEQTWSLTPEQLSGLQITPPEDYSGTFDLGVTATTEEADGGDTAETSGTLTVDVTGVADIPSLDLATPAVGDEDTAIALNINTGVTDASETLSVTISGVPDGAALSAGTENEDGTWTLSAEDLPGLTITPPENSDENFQLSVTATSTDGTDTATNTGTISVEIDAVADTPTLDLTTPATGDEDTAIALNIDPGLTDTDGSESLSITIANVPNGATLSAGTDNLDGTWTLSPDDLNGLTITPDDNFDGTFDLAVTATATEAAGGDTAVATGTLTVDVAAVADTPTDTLSDVSGAEDTGIPLSITVGGDDDIASIDISGVPTGATLTYVDTNGDTQTIEFTGTTATLTPDQLNGLQVTPPADSDADFQLSVTATAVDGSDTATASGTIDVAVTGVADTPTLNLTAAAGDEEAAIPLNIQTGLTDTDGSESLSISISGIPDGAVLASGGVPITITNNTAELTPVQLNNLTITPPADSSEDFQLSVTTTSTEADGDTASTSGTLDVTVNGVADTPTLDLTANVTGVEDTAIPLTINAGVTDADETLSVILNNIPDGATLTYVDGDGLTQDIGFTGTAATLTPDQLNGLAITPPPDSNDNFQLAVTAISNDEGDTATSSGVLNVGVVGDADAPIVNLFDAQGTEDNAISLNISAGLDDTDGSETLSSVTISNVPQGAVLSAGTDTGSGTWIVSADDLAGLSITPPEDFSGSFDLGVAVTSTENDGDTATTTGTMTVDVSGVADAPTLVLDSAAGIEDNAIALDINAGTTDASESLSISISGIPDGAVLNYVDDQGAAQTITASNGSATLTSEQLNDLTITPPADSNENFSLTVTASSTDGSDTATTTGTLDVTVFGDADTPTLDLVDAHFRRARDNHPAHHQHRPHRYGRIRDLVDHHRQHPGRGRAGVGRRADHHHRRVGRIDPGSAQQPDDHAAARQCRGHGAAGHHHGDRE